MKSTIVGISLLAGLLLSSCSKEKSSEIATPAAHKSVHVEYRVYDQSGNVNISYAFPGTAQQLEMRETAVNRNYFSLAFDYPSGNKFYVRASNITPSHSAVQAELYVDGVLKASGNTTSTSGSAVAEGNF